MAEREREREEAKSNTERAELITCWLGTTFVATSGGEQTDDTRKSDTSLGQFGLEMVWHIV